MKIKIGSIRQKAIVEGEANLLEENEILLIEDEIYPILKMKTPNGELKSYVIVPMEDIVLKQKKKSNKIKYGNAEEKERA